MTKLTDKLRYTVSPDGGTVTLYAVRLSTGAWEPAFTCHPCTVGYIRDKGLSRAIAAGLVRPA